jgi:hypothetical protein
MALALAQQGHGARARELADRAVAIARQAGLKEMEAQAQLTMGQVLSTSLYDADKTVVTSAGASPATSYFEQAITGLRQIGNDAELAKALEAHGRFLIESHDFGGGKDLLREALAIYARLGMRRGAEVEKVLSAV